MDYDFTNTDLKVDTLGNAILIISNTDGTTKGIPEQDGNADDEAMFAAFRKQYPTGKPIAEPLLADIQAQQTALLQTAYQAALTAGFDSSATGTKYHYNYGELDQMKFVKLTILFLSGKCPNPYPVPSDTGLLVSHDATQLAQLLEVDLNTFETNLQVKLHDYINKVNAATTNAAVLAVKWS